MTTSTEPFAPTSTEPTTTLPSSIDMGAVLPELNSPQERYDHGYKRAIWPATPREPGRPRPNGPPTSPPTKPSGPPPRRGRALCSASLARATERVPGPFERPRGGLTEQLIAAAFELAEAVVAASCAPGPIGPSKWPRRSWPTCRPGPAMVRVNPGDEAFMAEAATALAATRRDA